MSGPDLECKCHYICKTKCKVWYNDLLCTKDLQVKWFHKATEFYIKKYTKTDKIAQKYVQCISQKILCMDKNCLEIAYIKR